MHNLVDWLRYCRRVLRHPAHRAERPFHVIYFLLVAYYGAGPYAVAALVCGILTVVSAGDDPLA